MTTITITPGKLTLAQLRQIARNPATQLALDPAAHAAIDASAATVARVLAENRTVYGINTGFGLLANTKIAADELELLQRSIVLSHAAGIGEPMKDSTVRLVMALKINSLSRGFSGIRRVVLDAMITLFNKGIYPVIPQKGSVGASGDLAPLSHMSAVLIGEGEAFVDGVRVPGDVAMRSAGLAPITLAPKEGLALLNGTQASTAFALEGLFAAEDLYVAASVAGAMSVEAAQGSRTPFDDRIHQVRGHQGQIDAAAQYRALLGAGSQIADSHANCGKVQDPYSLRCQPQVMGACLTQI
ncbi:MAG: aromatic amino acid lyase, partial [Vogesella sp.]|nr:aromatic amino acid lyase [Vogesella sp.]